MSFLFPKAAAPPPPPPSAPNLGMASIAEAGAAERQRLASAEGQGYSGTDVTGGAGVNPATVSTTAKPQKTALGG